MTARALSDNLRQLQPELYAQVTALSQSVCHRSFYYHAQYSTLLNRLSLLFAIFQIVLPYD